MKYLITEDQAGMRLDLFVTEQLDDHSRSSATKLCEQGNVLVNDTPISKASYKVKASDTISITYEPSETPDISLPIIYEDDDCLVVDKPAGVLTHSKGAFNPEGTVATFIAPKLTGLSGERGGIVHRLDRITSGLLICAKNPEALSWLQKQFSQRRTKKTYIAVVEGKLDPAEAIIDMPIERNPKKPQTFRVGRNGKPAKTTYKVLSEGERFSLVELKPETGRTHQLRVHLSHFDHPIVGDTLYGGSESDRVYLHAHQLELTLPNHERRVFSSPVSDNFTSKAQS